MKLIDRQVVPGTEQPVIRIGHREFKKKNGSAKATKQWYAEWCIDSKQKCKKLGTTNLTKAIQLAHELAQKLRLGEPVSPKKAIRIDELVVQYMAYQRAQDRSPKTIEKYQYILDQFATWCQAHHKTTAASFSLPDYWKLLEWMRQKGWSDKTIYSRVIIIKQIFKWAHIKLRALNENVLAGETVREPQTNEQPCFTPEQVRILLDKADPHEAAIFNFMAFAGLRFGEVQQLRWSDINLNNDGTGSMTIRRGGSAGDKTKGRQIRSIQIHPELRVVVDKLPRQFDLIFTARASTKHPHGGSMISERRLLVSLKRLCARCNFANPDQYKLHTFRHSFASMLARSKETSYKQALALMGHKNSRVFDLYFTMFDKDAHKAIASIHYPRMEQPGTAA